MDAGEEYKFQEEEGVRVEVDDQEHEHGQHPQEEGGAQEAGSSAEEEECS